MNLLLHRVLAATLFGFIAAEEAGAVTYSASILHPVGFGNSLALDVTGSIRMGYGSGNATGDETHALLWNGAAGTFADLNPSGFFFSSIVDGSEISQVGFGRGSPTGGRFHALL